MRILKSEADKFLQDNSKYFESAGIGNIAQTLYKSNITLAELNTFKFKSPTAATVLSVMLGYLGIDRFYSGNYIMGIIKLCTFGLYGIWWIVDWFLVGKEVKRKNQSRFYGFLTGTAPVQTINMDAVKRIATSKEVRNAAKELKKSHDKFMDTFYTE